ncbi:hypothetical protein FACS1894156_6680 [Bacteroidia bacterium]|nr:hypothetical protein FACS1894156_6680 [Bacteroidia bacterium]
MKFVVEYDNYPVNLTRVKSAQYAGDFSVNLLFSDGFCRQVNFKPFLENTLHPSIRKYLNETKFKEFDIVDGNLNWNDYDLIFPLEDLYEGKL